MSAMDFSTLTTLLVSISDKVATITLNRPERLNAYTVAMGVELFRTLEALDDSDDARAIVITGAGRGFCAGMDLAGGGDTFAVDGQFEETRRIEARVQPWNMSTPIIAAINGPAVGIGATLPLQWDFRLASDRAKIGFVFTRRGITPEAGSTWILPRLIGLAKATDLLLTGRVLAAEEAHEYGLVSRVYPHEELLEAAQALGREIATHSSPSAVGVTKRLLWRQWMQPDPIAAKVREDGLFYWIGKQPDAAEGVKSFLEKRPPQWGPLNLPEELDELEADRDVARDGT